MAICKKCGKDIVDGEELCEECKAQSPVMDENYLDELLNSVNEETPDREIPKLSETFKQDMGLDEELETMGTKESTDSEPEKTAPLSSSSESSFSEDDDLNELLALISQVNDDNQDLASVEKQVSKNEKEKKVSHIPMERPEKASEILNGKNLVKEEEKNVPQISEEVNAGQDRLDKSVHTEEKEPVKQTNEITADKTSDKTSEYKVPDTSKNLVDDNEVPLLNPDVVGKEEKGAAFFTNLLSKLFNNVLDEKQIEKNEKKKHDEVDNILKQQELSEKKQQEKEAKKAAKLEKQEQKNQEKELKNKDKEMLRQQKLEEKRQRQEEEEKLEQQGRINPIGATIVCVFFAAIALVVIFGTTRFSYDSSIKKGKKYYENKQYDLSFDALQGLKLKKEDKVLYQKVRTIMYIYQEKQSSDIYMDLDLYAEALDSLLKGLRKYDKHIAEAKELGVDSNMNEVKQDVITQLQASFGLTEEQAITINSIVERVDYGKEIQGIVKRMMVQGLFANQSARKDKIKNDSDCGL